jgi:hypothetical protein
VVRICSTTRSASSTGVARIARFDVLEIICRVFGDAHIHSIRLKNVSQSLVTGKLAVVRLRHRAPDTLDLFDGEGVVSSAEPPQGAGEPADA